MEQPLSGKIALVTGVGGGIGRACAVKLAEQGACIVGLDADPAAAEETCERVEAVGGWARSLHVDLASADGPARAVESTLADQGGIHILVNAASFSGVNDSLLEFDERNWRSVLRMNLEVPRLMISLVGQHMARNGGGRIVSVSSSSGSRASPRRPSYSISKAALNALTRAAAAEFGEYGINVNAVAPGITRTPLQQGLRTEEEMSAAVRSGPLANFFGRVSEPDDVAATVVFLCLPGSRQITGQVVHTSAGVIV